MTNQVIIQTNLYVVYSFMINQFNVIKYTYHLFSYDKLEQFNVNKYVYDLFIYEKTI